ncbi:MAG TPA: hypothetical protein VH165_31680, partial [Kofleriaceae bacterium]|nr:hypothetical protein [Kofleriaceae bacterium]
MLLDKSWIRRSCTPVVMTCLLGVAALAMFNEAHGAPVTPIVVPHVISVTTTPSAPDPEASDATAEAGATGATGATDTTAPTARATDEVPTSEVPCITKDTRLTTNGQRPVLCWGTACRIYDRERTWEPSTLKSPPPAPAPLEAQVTVADAHGSWQACTGERCTPVGPHLAAALTAARAGAGGPDNDPFHAYATRDHGTVMFNSPQAPGSSPPMGEQAWNVARDHRLTLHRPATYGDDGFIVGISPLANQLLVMWSNCAGPCGLLTVADRDGHNVGSELEVGSVVQQALDRFVVLGGQGTLAVIDHGRVTVTKDALPTERLGDDDATRSEVRSEVRID